MPYTGSVDLISGIRPKNNGTFPLVDAKDVRVDDNTRLNTALSNTGTTLENAVSDISRLDTNLTNVGTQLSSVSTKANGAVRFDTAQTLTDEQKQQARTNIGAGEVDATLSVEGMAADAKKTGYEISALKGVLTDITGNGAIPITQMGKFIILNADPVDLASPSSNASWAYSAIDCTEGDVFTINAPGGNQPRAYAFLDENNTRLEVGATDTPCINAVVVAPKGAVKLVINSKANSYYGSIPKVSFNKIDDILTNHVGIVHVVLNRMAGSNRFINAAGVITTTSSTFGITLPIFLASGCEAHFTATGSTSNFTIIATCDESGGNISPKVLANSDGLEHEYIYKTDADTYIIVGYKYTEPAELFILSELANERLLASINGSVRYDVSQILTDDQKTLVRNNIGVVSSDDFSKAVRFDSQSLTPTQKTQVRANIDSPSISDLTEVRDDLSSITGNRVIPITASNKYINLKLDPVDLTNPQNSSATSYCVVECSAGDVFTINAPGGNLDRAYAFLDASNNRLEVEAVNTPCINKTVVAPIDAVKLVINSKQHCYFGSSLVTSIDVINNILTRHVGNQHILLSRQVGNKFINSAGNITSASLTFGITNPIFVSAGNEVHFTATGSTSNFAMISTCDENAENIHPEVFSKSDGLEHEYVYKTSADTYVIVGYNYTEPAELYILSELANERLLDKINSIDESGSDARVSYGYNLINHKTFTNNTSMDSSGNTISNTQYAISARIAVKPSTTYSLRNVYRVVYFDESGTKTGLAEPYGEDATVTTPANAAYAVIVINKGSSYAQAIYGNNEFQMVEGSVLPSYNRQRLLVDGYTVIDDKPSFIADTTYFRRWDKICVDLQPAFLLTTECQGLTNEDKLTNSIYAYYDALMSSNPDYISKKSIGTATDGHTIYQYDFVVPRVSNASSIDYDGVVLPKIILSSGTHGEYGGIYSLYNCMREITTNPNLEDLKFGAHYVVIPCVNPYGIDHLERKNVNGIDINRNYPIDWVHKNPEDNDYGGEEPFTEPECIALDSVFQENSDAIWYTSCHSYNRNANNYFLWANGTTKYTANIGSKLMIKMSREWRKKYPEMIPQTLSTYIGYIGITEGGGMEQKQATKYGIQGTVLEVCDYFLWDTGSLPYSSFAISRGCEAHVNFIRIILGCHESTDPHDITAMGLDRLP